MSRDAFGPNLRRIRMQKGISLEQIVRATNLSADLFKGLEKNNFSRWPSGIYARAFVRQYADAIGVDADATVDEFCRCFPHGDRRAEPIFRGQAEIVGHDLSWQDSGQSASEADRRGAPAHPVRSIQQPAHSPLGALFGRLRRVLGKA